MALPLVGIWFFALFLFVLPSAVDRSAAQVSVEDEMDLCAMAESCFQAAAMPKERLGKTLTKDQILSLKLARLHRLMERFPSSLWAKRAALLSGVLLVERNPAVSLQFLRTAQRDFPLLDDYIRLWMGDALLRLGDAKQAAELFESIPADIPASSLLAKVTYRAGEAWYQASSCPESSEWFARAIALNDKEPSTPQGYLRLGACYLRENRVGEAREALQQLWVRFPFSAEAKEAESLLASNPGGEQWMPQPADRFARAQAFLAQAFHAEAVEELRKFLAADPQSPQRFEAKLKLGIAHVRLKQYDQARETFRAIAGNGGTESREAMVWLARVYLRQGQGDKLLEIARAAQTTALSAEQKGQVALLAGIWLEDQKQYDEAIARYRQVMKTGEPASQRAEAQWRIGWLHYRLGRHREAIETLRGLVGQSNGEYEPQALYWMGRTFEKNQQAQAADLYSQLCQRYVYTYYCQLARERGVIPSDREKPTETADVDVSANGSSSLTAPGKSEIAQESAFRRAIELKTLGLDADAAREVSVLVERHGQNADAVVALCTLLNEAGAYYQALRLARSRFRDTLERTGGTVAAALWDVAYPAGLLPAIRLQGTKAVDPYLIAAIIREESQFDLKAVSRVGAIGLMQVMPATASTVAQRMGMPAVGREDLFDQETNIRIGVRYVEQLFEQFSGNLVYVIAAYNAGPAAVTAWVAQYGNLNSDEFVELIPYQETRQYVKRVLRSYREYARLGRNS
jgi:soluble lytic murein transglycosylase